ncbi:MAG: four helix bundle protein, partial [Parcubacteria group bacterium]
GLISQLRRAAISITSNIAEGFSRHTYKQKINFYSIALGSLTELQNQIIVAKDIKYINTAQYDEIFAQSIIVHKMINGLIKTSKIYLENHPALHNS